MNELNYSASAFPSVYHPHGLTKRELFAAMAMQGIQTGVLGNENVLQAVAESAKAAGVGTDEYTAMNAVALADALLAELAKEPT